MKKTLSTTIALLSTLSFNAMAECPKFVEIAVVQYISSGIHNEKNSYINACKVSRIHDVNPLDTAEYGAKTEIYFDFLDHGDGYIKYIQVTQTKAELIAIFNAQ